MINRRQFLETLGIGAAAAAFTVDPGVLGRALASGVSAGAFMPQHDTAARDPLAHVISRLTYGVTPALYSHVREIGVQAFIEEQLAPETIEDSAAESAIEPLLPILNENGGVLRVGFENDRGTVALALIGGTIVRQMLSKRQLYERMVHFWGDHFSVYVAKGQVLFLKVDDDRDVTRSKGMTTFRQILGASAHSPAMLLYLDNAQNERSHPNENYARELLELHTLGVHGGYTEADVQEVARVLTGWSVSGRQQNADGRIVYEFREMFHDNGDKVVLGTTIPSNGEQEGEQLLDLLARHPSTARHVATKLARRFVADTPPESIIDAAAATFLDSGGDIRATLRTIFNSQEFWNAPPKYKQPTEYVVSLLRALDYRVDDPRRMAAGLRDPLDTMGNLPFTWAAPNGFPDVQSAWQDGLITRWNMAIGAVYGQLRGAELGSDSLIALLTAEGVDMDTESVLLFMGRYLFGRDLTTTERDIVVEFAQASGTEGEGQIGAGLSLLLASPAFQYR